MIFWIWYGATLFTLITFLGVRIILDYKELKKKMNNFYDYDTATNKPPTSSSGKWEWIKKKLKL